MIKMKEIIGSFLLLAMLTTSCSTTNPAAHTTSSKTIYSMMIKDHVGIESRFSEELMKSLDGNMVIRALASVEKRKGDLEGIEFVKSTKNVTVYDMHMKKGKVTLKLLFNDANQIENIWMDDIALNKK